MISPNKLDNFIESQALDENIINQNNFTKLIVSSSPDAT